MNTNTEEIAPIQQVINIAELEISYASLYLALGYQNSFPPKYIVKLIQKMLTDLKGELEICGGYQVYENEFSVIDKKRIAIEKLEFNTQKIITSHLRKAEGAVLFVCTLGEGFDNWRQVIEDEDDMLKLYIADILGSELVEAAADILESNIASKLREKDFNITNRYSPGYCDWNVSEQHKLFSLLPNKFCGIDLTESALMLPIKSVSGIIGFGKGVKKADYNCKICSMENCYMRVREVKQEVKKGSLEVNK